MDEEIFKNTDLKVFLEDSSDHLKDMMFTMLYNKKMYILKLRLYFLFPVSQLWYIYLWMTQDRTRNFFFIHLLLYRYIYTVYLF